LAGNDTYADYGNNSKNAPEKKGPIKLGEVAKQIIWQNKSRQNNNDEKYYPKFSLLI